MALKLRLTLDVLYHSAHDFLIVGLCWPSSSWIGWPVNPLLRLQTCHCGSYPWVLGTKVRSLYSCSKPASSPSTPNLKIFQINLLGQWAEVLASRLARIWSRVVVKDVSAELQRGLVASHLGNLVLYQKAVDSMWWTSWERLKYFPVSVDTLVLLSYVCNVKW